MSKQDFKGEGRCGEPQAPAKAFCASGEAKYTPGYSDASTGHQSAREG
jgi:hypothetical protein